MSKVASIQRFSRRNPCPICGGGKDDPAGQGVRCFGFLSDDGQYAHCTREDYAGDLTSGKDNTFAHRLGGSCRCGEPHNGVATGPRTAKPPRQRFNVFRSTYPAITADGRRVGVHCRTDYTSEDGTPHKDMWWEDHHERGSEEMPLYNLPALAKRRYGSRVYLVEGEKKCDRLNEAFRASGVDALAVATVTGADGMPCDATLVHLIEHNVVLWPDADMPNKNHPNGAGQEHMGQVAAWLRKKGEHPRWVHWADAPAKGDVADFLAAGHAVSEIEDMVVEVPLHTFPPPLDNMAGDTWESMGNNDEADDEANDEADDEVGDRASGQCGKSYESWPGVLRLSEVQKKARRWLWHPYIVRNKANVWEGDPGVGKSLLIALLASVETKGEQMRYDTRPGWALGHADADGKDRDPGGNVLLLAGEDDAADTILPRIEAAGGNTARVFVLEKVPYTDAKGVTRPRSPRLPSDTDSIMKVVRGEHCRLLVVDPLTSFLDKDVNPNSDAEIRAALDRLVDDCAAENCTTLFLRHLNKGSGQSALYKGAGSIGIAGLARSVCMVAEDPDAPDSVAQHVFAHVKINVARKGATLVFQKFVPTQASSDAEPTIDWKGTSTRTADEIYRLLAQKQAGQSGEERGKRLGKQLNARLRKAVKWLRSHFAAADPHDDGLPSREVIAQGQKAGLSEKDVRNAGAYLKVQQSREGFQGPVYWHYDPEKAPPEEEERQDDEDVA